MDRAETVTLFNDMCLLAPGTLIDPGIAWEAVDATTARARFTNGGQTITATLLFDSAGQLTNFVSDDRSRSSPDGTFTPRRFSTPLRDYRDFGPVRLASFRRGEMAAARRRVHVRRVQSSWTSPTTCATEPDERTSQHRAARHRYLLQGGTTRLLRA